MEIQAHTDSQGGNEYNYRLSERRAASVMIFFVAEGVDQGRLTSRGFGEGKPIADNDTAEGRLENRRVELRVK